MCKKELGVRTVLGVSNISFGLPCRGYMNTTFLTLAMQAGLDLAIMNPNTPEMMAAVRAYRVLTSQDEKCNDYVAAYANVQVQTSQVAKTDAAAPAGGAAGADALFEAVRRGLKKRSPRRCRGSPENPRAFAGGERNADPRAGCGGRCL